MNRTLVIGAREPSGTALDDLVAAFSAAARSLGKGCEFVEAYGPGVKMAETGDFTAVLLYLIGNVQKPAEIICRLKTHTEIVIVLVGAGARLQGEGYHPYFALECCVDHGASGFFDAVEHPPEQFLKRVVRVLATKSDDEHEIQLSFKRKKGLRFAFIATPYEMLRRSEFEAGVEAALTRLGWRWQIGDHVVGQGSIHDAVYKQIRRADVVIANLTGANTNVIYEAGVAVRKNRILMRKYDDDADLPLLLTNGLIVPFYGPIDLAQTLYRGLSAIGYD